MKKSNTRARIQKFLARRALKGDPPSVREIATAVGLSSPSSVQKHLKAMEREGIIEQGSRRQSRAGLARSWRLIGEADPTKQGIPVLGRIACGYPIDNPDDPLDEKIPIPANSFARSGTIVALRVEGDSMIDAGIMPGDFAVIRKQATVENGEVAAVQIDGEGTLKRWRERSGKKGKSKVQLEAANRHFPPITLNKRKTVEVYGKLVGVVRMY